MRVSFAGGGTDLADFYERAEGAVFSTTIDQYVYVTVKGHSEVFDERIRLNYFRSEQVSEVDEIENDIARECLRLLQVEPPIYVGTVADLPASSGLGGSASFCVGLLNALHAYRGERVSAAQLAEEASHIEMGVLGRPVGKQDQYAAAFGGLNLLRFMAGGRVTVEPQRTQNGTLRSLFDSMLLFWTGTQRDAGAVLREQRESLDAKMDPLMTMRDHAHQLNELASEGLLNDSTLGEILDATWRTKRELAGSVTTSEIDGWYQRAMDAGADGGKLCGAGGGGFLLFVVPPERQTAVKEALRELICVRVGPEVHGTQILCPSMD